MAHSSATFLHAACETARAGRRSFRHRHVFHSTRAKRRGPSGLATLEFRYLLLGLGVLVLIEIDGVR